MKMITVVSRREHKTETGLLWTSCQLIKREPWVCLSRWAFPVRSSSWVVTLSTEPTWAPSGGLYENYPETELLAALSWMDDWTGCLCRVSTKAGLLRSGFRDESVSKRLGGLQKMTSNGCQHLSAFKAAQGTEPFRIIHAHFIACTSADALRRKVWSW